MLVRRVGGLLRASYQRLALRSGGFVVPLLMRHGRRVYHDGYVLHGLDLVWLLLLLLRLGPSLLEWTARS